MAQRNVSSGIICKILLLYILKMVRKWTCFQGILDALHVFIINFRLKLFWHRKLTILNRNNRSGHGKIKNQK